MTENRSESGKTGGISGTWEYAADIYTEKEIRRLSDAYVAILKEIASGVLMTN
jgi:hypothetical protein